MGNECCTSKTNHLKLNDSKERKKLGTEIIAQLHQDNYNVYYSKEELYVDLPRKQCKLSNKVLENFENQNNFSSISKRR